MKRNICESVASVAMLVIFAWLIWAGVEAVTETADNGGVGASVSDGAGEAVRCLKGYRLDFEEEPVKTKNDASGGSQTGEGASFEWFMPEEAEIVWEDVSDISAGDINVPRKDIGCANPEEDAVLAGWDGHTMAEWEMDLFARTLYLEFWGCSETCCEAGADSILNLWASGYFGDTIGELLTATAENGSLVYSPYAYVWDWDYDADGLAEMRSICEERFYGGPQYDVKYFRLWFYHPWAVDAFVMDGVYFSK